MRYLGRKQRAPLESCICGEFRERPKTSFPSGFSGAEVGARGLE